MQLSFYIKAFCAGVAAGSAVGPLFMLTFNRAARCGVVAGCVTGAGIACGDGLFFFLGLAGFLSLVERTRNLMLLFDLVGASVLLVAGVRTLLTTARAQPDQVFCRQPYVLAFIQAWMLTILNPLGLLFFVGVSFYIIPKGVTSFGWSEMIMGASMVMSGSFLIFSTVSYIARHVGMAVNRRFLNAITTVNGFFFISVSGYLFYSALVLARIF